MSKDHIIVWNNCMATIQKIVPSQSFETWFRPIMPVSLRDDALTLQVPNKFFYEWLEEHYVDILKTSIRKELGDKAILTYQIVMQNSMPAATRTKPTLVTSNAMEDQDFEAFEKKPNDPYVIPGIPRRKIDPNLKADFQFSNFIEGDCNRLARAAGVAVAKSPGKTSFNPLVLYGNSGLGKTHLAQAIGNQVLEQHEKKTVKYVTLNAFTNEFVNSIKNNNTEDFVNYYMMLDVLIIDDIHELENKQKTQEIFFHIFNHFHQNSKQLIFTCDKPPRDLKGVEDRLVSRFKWGLSADLQTPDFETRLAIFESKMNRQGVDIPNEVVEFICTNIQNNIRELEGVLISLVAHSSLNQKDIDLTLARDVVKNFISSINREITVEFIQKLVAEHYKMTLEDLLSTSRKRQVVVARQISMYLAKNQTDKSLKSIGEDFGGKDHTTVMHAIKTVKDLIETDSVYKEAVSELERKIRMSLGAK